MRGDYEKMDTVGKRIKRIRTNQKLTQKEFADKIGIARSTLAGYETNQIEPSLNIIFKISDTFSVKPSYFLRTMYVDLSDNEDDIVDELDKMMNKISTRDVAIDGELIEYGSDISRLTYFEIKKTKETIIQYLKILKR